MTPPSRRHSMGTRTHEATTDIPRTEECVTHLSTATTSQEASFSPRSRPMTSTAASSPPSHSFLFPSKLRACLALNAVQRILSAAALAPLVTVFLWQSPAFATVTVCSLIQSLCCYEFAWIAHRIQHRILRAFEAMEQANTSSCTPMAAQQTGFHVSEDDAMAILQASMSQSDVLTPQTLSDDALRQSRSIHHQQSDVDVRHTVEHDQLLDSRPSHETVSLSTTSPTQPHNRQSQPAFSGDVGRDEIDESHCAVSKLASYLPWQSHPRLCVWIVANLTSAVICALASSLILFLIIPWVPELDTTEFYDSRVFYTIATNYVGALCSCFSPNWRYAVVIFIENMAFTVLTMYSTVCPINQYSCSLSVEPAHVLLVSIGLLLLIRFTTSRSGPEAFVLFVLDGLGFLYIIGSLSVLVAFVDDDKKTLYRKLLIVLLYVTWASDTGAYVTGKFLSLVKYPCYHPLAAHLSKNKDYEGTLGAVLWGIAAMFVASNVLAVDGDAWTKVAFTVLGVIIGRFGDLFESLLKRAAGVKDSGSIIPGHGGVLDRIDALMFVTLVFARYYTMVLRDSD